MKLRSINWPIWAGFLLSLLATISYPLIFVQWPITRDFPWVTLFLGIVALLLVVAGIKRAFAPGKRAFGKVLTSVLAVLTVGVLGMFVFGIFILASWLPESKGAPQVGQKAPEFTLTDTSGKSVALTELMSTQINGKAPRGVLLIFYRGHW